MRFFLTCVTGLAVLFLAPEAGLAQGMGKMSMPKAEYGTSAAFAKDGSLLAVTKQGEHVMLYRSGDDGKTWQAPVVVNTTPEAISADGENRPKLVVLADGAVLVSWTRPLAKPYSGEIRLARSADGGRHFDPPITVHRDRAVITHRFETPVVAADGKVYLAWIDKRDLEAAKIAKRPYRGAAIYSAVSNDGGRSFQPETKVADHSCECCRIAAAIDTDGAPVFLWRHVFEPNERDHAIAKLNPDGTPVTVERATFDRWRVDACPHHGPSLAIAANGTRHAVWFDQVNGEGRIFYGRLQPHRIEGQRTVGSDRAAHADLGVHGEQVAIAWKEFDGERTVLHAELSADGGEHFKAMRLASTSGASDQPRVLQRSGIFYVFWRTELEGMRLFPVQQ
jgi:hypothetical protein